LTEVAAHDHILTPGRYVGTVETIVDPDAEPIINRVERLTKDLYALFEESSRLDVEFRRRLGGIDA
jgi:type I restriction enzyme M protein